MKKYLKKAWYYLQLLDGIWSVPLGFFLFFLVGYGLTMLFGNGVGAYDPSFVQPLFLAIVIVIGALNAAVWGLYFNFRGLYRFFYGEKKALKDERGKELPKTLVNYSKINWTKLRPWDQFRIAFCVIGIIFLAIILVYLKLV